MNLSYLICQALDFEVVLTSCKSVELVLDLYALWGSTARQRRRVPKIILFIRLVHSMGTASSLLNYFNSAAVTILLRNVEVPRSRNDEGWDTLRLHS